MSTIVVMYDCPLCGMIQRKVLVRARDEDEGVVAWVREVIAETGLDHSIASPECRPRELRNLMFSVKDADYIGQAPKDEKPAEPEPPP